MKKRMTKIVTLALAMSMVVSVASGCGKKDDKPTTKSGDFTYHDYQDALATNWNPHTWEMNADDAVIQLICTPLVDMSIKNLANTEYQWTYEAATYINDVTADHQDDLTKYNVTLAEGATASDVKEGYVFEIGLNKDMRWEDGTQINADTYIYSVQQLLNPKMQNYRANNWYAGDYALVGAQEYYYGGTTSAVTLSSQGFDGAAAAIAGGIKEEDILADSYGFWNAKGYKDKDGNEMPQYVSIKDTTVYNNEAGDDPVSGADLYALLGPGGMYEQHGAEYLAFNKTFDEVSWDTVGFYKVDDYTVRYVCKFAADLNYILGHFASPILVYEPLYEKCKSTTGDLVTSNYGTSKDTTMSYGVYKLDSLQDGKQMVLVQNEQWYGFEKQEDGSLVSFTQFDVDGEKVQQYMTTKYVIDVMDDDAAKQAFLKGELSAWTPSADDLPTYVMSDQLYKADETYTMRLIFNTNLDKLKEMDKSKGNTNSVVMSNEKFRKAFSLCIDRNEWIGATQGYKAAFALLSSLYYYDVYNDPTSIYRNTDFAKQAIVDLYGVKYGEGEAYATLDEAAKSINGYNLTEAKNLMAEACKELVAAGLYKEGEDIVIRIGYAKGPVDSGVQQQTSLFNKYINAAVEGSGFGKVTLEAIGNIEDRYNDVVNGEFAIAYGAWGGAAFYPFGMMQLYCDPDYTSVHEIGCYDPATEKLTLTVNGTEDTMTWQAWSQSLEGVGKYANADMQVKIEILSKLEEKFLEKYYCIPLATTAACTMLSYQVEYYTHDYNIMYGFGGLRLLRYNKNDAEWAEYLKENNNTLKYE